VRSLTDVLLVSQDLDPDKGQDMIGGECMAVGVPWLEFQSGLGSGVQDPGVDVGKGKDNERGNADGKRLAGSETEHGSDEVVWFEERLEYLPFSCTRSMPPGTHLTLVPAIERIMHVVYTSLWVQ
jgi:hypothetical protein